MKNFFLSLFSLVFFLACSNEDYDNALDSSKSEETVLKFVFEDKEYSSIIYELNDSTFEFKDKNVEEVYNSLQELPNLTTSIEEDGTLYYYKDEVELDNDLRIKTRATKVRYPLPLFIINFYEGSNYTGYKAPFRYGPSPGDGPYLDHYIDWYYVSPNMLAVRFLDPWNFKDKLGSFEIGMRGERGGNDIYGTLCLADRNVEIRLYEKSKFNGKALRFVSTYRGLYCESLERINYAKIKWHKNVSSFRILN